MNGRCSVAIHLISSRRASACATHAVAGERAWISETPGVAQAGGELARQGEPRPQRMAALGQLEMRGAQPQQVGHHGAARRGDDGRAAGRDHGLRRVERGAREAAAGEGRDDLQERRSRHVSLAVGLLLWQVIWHERSRQSAAIAAARRQHRRLCERRRAARRRWRSWAASAPT